MSFDVIVEHGLVVDGTGAEGPDGRFHCQGPARRSAKQVRGTTGCPDERSEIFDFTLHNLG